MNHSGSEEVREYRANTIEIISFLHLSDAWFNGIIPKRKTRTHAHMSNTKRGDTDLRLPRIENESANGNLLGGFPQLDRAFCLCTHTHTHNTFPSRLTRCNSVFMLLKITQQQQNHSNVDQFFVSFCFCFCNFFFSFNSFVCTFVFHCTIGNYTKDVFGISFRALFISCHSSMGLRMSAIPAE